MYLIWVCPEVSCRWFCNRLNRCSWETRQRHGHRGVCGALFRPCLSGPVCNTAGPYPHLLLATQGSAAPSQVPRPQPDSAFPSVGACGVPGESPLADAGSLPGILPPIQLFSTWQGAEARSACCSRAIKVSCTLVLIHSVLLRWPSPAPTHLNSLRPSIGSV